MLLVGLKFAGNKTFRDWSEMCDNIIYIIYMFGMFVKCHYLFVECLFAVLRLGSGRGKTIFSL